MQKVRSWIKNGLFRIILKELTSLQPLLVVFSCEMEQLLKIKVVSETAAV